MKIAERIVMVSLLFVLIGGGAWIYFAVQYEQQEVVEAVYRGEYQKPIETEKPKVAPEDWRTIYPNTTSVIIGDTVVDASVADTLSKRIKGLSDTQFLPESVVKLFAFGVPGNHSIWMKNMNYPLDIIWLAEDGEIVHIEDNILPETFPESFSSPVPAWYVIEANAGFVASNTVVVGDTVVLPEWLQ
ncbi:MAG: uncharacterized membrane protein (UPF0127 family) [Candidatus Paceibacteria bacterium]|jgi:uncharacterized membrane protein (UPF0127 family)